MKNSIFDEKSKKFKNLLFLYISFLVSLFLLITLYFLVNGYMNYELQNNVKNRLFIISSNSSHNKKPENNNVIFFNNYNSITSVNGDENYIFEYYDFPITLTNDKIINKLYDNEIIIPDNIDIVSIFNIQNNIHELEIVGKYDTKIGLDSILVSEEFIKQFVDETNSYIGFIDDIDNVDTVLKELKNSNYNVDYKFSNYISNVNFFIDLIGIISNFILILIFLIIILFSLVLKHLIFSYKKNIAILKTVGYKNKTIMLIMIKEVNRFVIKYLLIFLIAVMFIYIVLTQLSIESYIKFELMLLNIVITVVIFCLINFISYIYNFRYIFNINPIRIFQSE